jgi:hypothetical protein
MLVPGLGFHRSVWSFDLTPGSYQRDYYTSAKREVLQGVEDP